jgi:hypothetical protein
VKCKEAEIAMSLERDRQLDEETRVALHAHLAQCVDCQRWSRTMHSVLDGAALPRLRASAGFEASVLARATSAPAVASTALVVRPWLYALAGAAATLIATLALGWLAGLTPTVQAGAVLDDALRSHQSAIMDFARSVTLLPGARPEAEVDLVRRDLAESHLLPRTQELRALVRVAKCPEQKPVLEFLRQSESFLGEVQQIVREEMPKDAIVRIRRAAAGVQPGTFQLRLQLTGDVLVDGVHVESGEMMPGEPRELQVVTRARSEYFRGNLPAAMSGFQTFVLRSEGDTSLQPFRPFVLFSLERCEERLGLGGEWSMAREGTADPKGEKQVILKVAGERPRGVRVTGPQVETFFILLDQGGVKLDAHDKKIVEGALLKVTSANR